MKEDNSCAIVPIKSVVDCTVLLARVQLLCPEIAGQRHNVHQNNSIGGIIVVPVLSLWKFALHRAHSTSVTGVDLQARIKAQKIDATDIAELTSNIFSLEPLFATKLGPVLLDPVC